MTIDKNIVNNHKIEQQLSEPKHQDALKTIGEVAAHTNVATHVLRFWESKFSQITPQKRRGRRYYSPSDITVILTIKELLYDKGYTIKGVHKHLKDKSPAKTEISAPPPQNTTEKLQNIHNKLIQIRDELAAA